MGNLFSDAYPICDALVGNGSGPTKSSGIFGGNRVNASSTMNIEETIINLKTAQETIDARIKHLNCQITNQVTLAKIESAKGNKQGALLCLKRKRIFETNITNMLGAHFNLEQQINSIETTQLNSFTFDAITRSAALMKSMNASMDVDAVEETMNYMKEQYDTVDEFGKILASNYSNLDMDENQFEKELMELMTENETEEGIDEIFPFVPQNIIGNRSESTVMLAQTTPSSSRNKTTIDNNKALEEFGSLYF